MKFQFYYEKLLASDEYLKFKKEHPTAFACSGFFAVDKEKDGANDKVNFDFWLPEHKKMYSFDMMGQIEFINVENFDVRPYEPLSMNYTFDLKDVEKKIIERKEAEGIKGEMQKLLFSLQKLDGVDFLVATIFLNNMGMLKVTYDIADESIDSFEKKSFLDIFKIHKK
jgi:hypothetical protein